MNEVRILIVDDMPQWRALLVECLQETGWQVDTAADLEEARRLMDQSSYDLLFLDIRLADDDPGNQAGMRFLEELAKSDEKTPGVVMLSAYGTQEMMRAAFVDFHVLDFLSKETFDPDELVTSIAESWLPLLRSSST